MKSPNDSPITLPSLSHSVADIPDAARPSEGPSACGARPAPAWPPLPRLGSLRGAPFLKVIWQRGTQTMSGSQKSPRLGRPLAACGTVASYFQTSGVTTQCMSRCVHWLKFLRVSEQRPRGPGRRRSPDAGEPSGALSGPRGRARCAAQPR